MTFNSIAFLIFIALFFLFWPLAKKKNKIRWAYITVMSFIFYSWLDWRFIFLLLFTGLLDYYTGQIIYRSVNRKKLWLLISILANVLSLVIFKYSLFIAKIFDFSLIKIGLAPWFVSHIPEFTLILPLGISFYTFNSMSYTIDIYRGNLKPITSPLQFMAFISFFPHLVAGPIIRAKDILFQLERNKIISQLELWNGIQLIVFGLFQKMVLADNLSVFVDKVYQGLFQYESAWFYWVWAIAFSFQIYFDFSGYSQIAKGIAKICGIQFRMNFNHPYLSKSLREFWNRWHISLSHWFRDYVYKSLGGNRDGKIKSNINMWITMLISGLWHGANITFIIWGAIHAFFTVIERITGWPRFFEKNVLLTVFGRFLVLFQVVIAWVFFRCQSVGEAFSIVTKMFSFGASDFGFIRIYFFDIVVWLVFAFLIELYAYVKQNNMRIKRLSTNMIYNSLTVSFAAFCILFFRGPEVGFIYFQF